MTSRWRPCSLTAWIPRMMKDLSPTLVSIRSMDEPHLMFFVHIRFVNSVCLFHMSLFVCAQTKKNPHHSALCTLYHQLDLKNTNKPKNMCMRVSMFACPFLQHYTRKKKKNRPTPECQTYGLCTVIASCLPAVCRRSTWNWMKTEFVQRLMSDPVVFD